MSEILSLPELVGKVNAWCEEHGVVPANGQAADQLSERNVRFYRTAGLLDAPDSADGRGYSEKHRLQLTAIRLLQAQGLPLRRIRELLHGRTIHDLKQIERRGRAELDSARSRTLTTLSASTAVPGAGEIWSVMPVDDEFHLVSRRGRSVPAEVLAQIGALIRKAQAP